MIRPFICGSGSGSFKHQLEDDDEFIGSPRKPRKGSKNPYSDRGLDKFSALLAELEDKRKEIYTQFGSEEISFVRFAYSNSNDCQPIVVKVKERNHKQQQQHLEREYNKPMEETNSEAKEVQNSRVESGDAKINEKNKKKSKKSWEFLKREMWRRPSYYMPAAVILILVFLALFGRSFTILCTSIGWYLVPTISGGVSKSSTNVRRVRKKKDYARRASEKGIVYDGGLASPTSVIAGAMNEFSPPRRGHRKSF